MKKMIIPFLFLSISSLAVESFCKDVKTCTTWSTEKTGAKYELGRFDKRSLNIEKDFNPIDLNPDYVINYVLQANDYLRIKKSDGVYEIIQVRDLKDYQIPHSKIEEIPNTLDLYSAEFVIAKKEAIKSAIFVLKKLLSKNGRVLEVANSSNIVVVDDGLHLNMIKNAMKEL